MTCSRIGTRKRARSRARSSANGTAELSLLTSVRATRTPVTVPRTPRSPTINIPCTLRRLRTASGCVEVIPRVGEDPPEEQLVDRPAEFPQRRRRKRDRPREAAAAAAVAVAVAVGLDDVVLGEAAEQRTLVFRDVERAADCRRSARPRPPMRGGRWSRCASTGRALRRKRTRRRGQGKAAANYADESGIGNLPIQHLGVDIGKSGERDGCHLPR